MYSDGGTPLRNGLEDVGQYFDQDDSNDGNIGSSPFSTEAEGGGCQKAYAIAMTDGFWNGSSPGVGNVDDDATSYSGEAPYTDTYSDTLADVAMKYYYDDIASSLSDIVPTDSCNGASHQHMATYSVSFGVTGTLDPNDLDDDGTAGPYYEDDPCFLNQDTPMPSWPDPADGDQEKIDDLWHAAVNGRGLYFNAQDPEQLVRALTQIVSDIGEPASGASVSVNSNELKEGLAVYQTRYVANEWSGDVIAFPVDAYSGAILNDEADILWHAKDQIPAPSSRKIVTYDGSSGISFSYSSLTTAQQDSLLFATEDDDALAEARVNYIRGDTSGVETYGFRYREALLGDVVHSAPTLSPSGEMLYVGANDGMLHAFDTETGEELFAYVPNVIFENLKYLTKSEYEHKFFVDLTPTVKALGSQRTLLVGGLGHGGKGIYALNLYEEDEDGNVLVDVENASITQSYLANNVVEWEYSAASANDDDLGYTYSKPAIVRSNDPDHEWVIIIGNGYNSTNESAVLYVFDLDGTLLRKIDTGVTGSNGLSEPSVVDTDGDFIADYAYAGDLNGNLWKFDLSADDNANWDVAYKDGSSNPAPLFSATGQSITSRPDVMYHCERHGFMVVFGTGKFTGETDRTDSTMQTIYGIWDYGDDSDDGEYLGEILTRGTAEATLSLDGSTASGLKLLRQTVIDARFIDSDLYRTLSDNKPVNTDDPAVTWPVVDDADSGEKSNPQLYAGWFLDLRTEEDSNDDDDDDAYSGERVIKDVLINDGRAFVVSFIPNSSPCSGGGDSFIYILDACTGGRLDVAQFELGNDVDNLIDLDGDPTTTDDLVASTAKLYTGMLHEPTFVSKDGGKDKIYISSTTGEILEEDIPAEPSGMIYWQLLN
jgi:Tfp pilus tip-associated adhesin PilY1